MRVSFAASFLVTSDCFTVDGLADKYASLSERSPKPLSRLRPDGGSSRTLSLILDAGREQEHQIAAHDTARRRVIGLYAQINFVCQLCDLVFAWI